MTTLTAENRVEHLSESSVHALADSLARQIIAREGTDALDLTAGLTGSFTLAIKYNTTTYNLTVTIPTEAGGIYVFALTEAAGTGPANDIASFKYKDQSDWAVAIGLPAPISFGGISIETLTLALGMGTVTA